MLVVRVIGVGGAGCNIVEHIRREHIAGVERTVRIGQAIEPRQLDVRLTAGVDRELSDIDAAAIRGAVRGADTVFVVAGMGGATGTRVAPLVARAARAEGAVTVAVLAEPFRFEGKRCDVARRGVRLMAESSDGLIRISNEERSRRVRADVSILAFFEQVSDEIALRLREVISEARSAT